MKFLHKRTAGFSLLELMVVVAIIGVLATVAVPRFNIFRARARQGEAKSNLGVIFTLQEAFKIDKEAYYDGAASWGGTRMDRAQDRDGYRGNGATDPSLCRQNKLGFRLANCAAARYGYWISDADESNFLAIAYATSDADKRIFPGCNGSSTNQRSVRQSDTEQGKRCSRSTDAGGTLIAPGTYQQWGGNQLGALVGGDAFCLDQKRTVDNFRDIVADPDCVN